MGLTCGVEWPPLQLSVAAPGLQGFARALLQQLLRSGMLALALLAALWLTGQRMPWQAEPGARACRTWRA